MPGAAAVPTHTFLAAAPEPGCLWLFSGAVPHCVLPLVTAGTLRQRRRMESGTRVEGDHEGNEAEVEATVLMAPPRVSVAINLVNEASPPSRIR